ncbi:DUF4153 domain-containing protein [Bifidobacterium vansinderenii]|uniref:DUF4173 domain-containing protein n=1 Tax=Bifidobacterium vansinderenii TaxID=1984871 RepID=A0A229W0F6_9BIFI|nr:DUF4173 domain-containing protein [Bifidobacterium vansinderenii]OXN01363.1 hypothetical protein Tam10B_0366 [Bifidobacterium vansinderenii]
MPIPSSPNTPRLPSRGGELSATPTEGSTPKQPHPTTNPAPPLPRRIILTLAASILIPVLFDRLVVANLAARHVIILLGVFWLACVAIITTLNWRTARRNPFAWFTAAAIAALTIWLIIAERNSIVAWNRSDMAGIDPQPWLSYGLAPTDGLPFIANDEYEMLTGLIVVPALLMLHAQLVGGLFSPTHPFGLVLRWLSGWVVQPFNRINAFAATLGRLVNNIANRGKRPMLARIGIALLICIPLIGVLLALLASADMVFAYGLSRMVRDVNVNAILFHGTAIVVPIPFLYSLLVNLGPNDVPTNAAESLTKEPPTEKSPIRESAAEDSGAFSHSRRPSRFAGDLRALYSLDVRFSLDPTITMIVLGAVLIVYAVFCSVQFTFLFAGAGLPDGLTYAEYARSGFFQLLFVATVNLAGFGLVLTYARVHTHGTPTPASMPTPASALTPTLHSRPQRNRTITGMLIGLIAATGILLASAATRLALYIGAYGLTWLRFISMAFIGLLAMVLALCIAKMMQPRIPLITVCALLFVVWYVAVGYADPASLIQAYNETHGFTVMLP